MGHLKEERLVEKARATCDLLIQVVIEAELIENICLTYEEVCDETLARFEVQPRELDQDDLNCLLFEILCFATFIIMGQEAPKFIVQKRLLFFNTPDAEDIQYFNSKLLERLQEHFDIQKLGTIREVVLTAITPDSQFGLGEPPNAAKRIASYVRSGSSVKAAQLFAQYVAYAVDPENYPVLKIIGMKFVEPIVDLVRIVLEAVFEGKKKG